MAERLGPFERARQAFEDHQSTYHHAYTVPHLEKAPYKFVGYETLGRLDGGDRDQGPKLPPLKIYKVGGPDKPSF